MTPLERLRIEKAASDCGFEMTPRLVPDGLELRSARFPEYITLTGSLESGYWLTSKVAMLLDVTEANRTVFVQGFDGLYEALSRASARAKTLPNRVADTFREDSALLPRSTEAERLVVQRVGQNLFRSALLDFFGGRCCVTGLAVPELLRASHIKPWADCTSDEERLDVFNGLLLAPNLDALFDCGWITFDEAGQVIVSAKLPADARECLGVSGAWRIDTLSPRHRCYLAYHRERVFRLV
jgi:putative restriction endonuclease